MIFYLCVSVLSIVLAYLAQKCSIVLYTSSSYRIKKKEYKAPFFLASFFVLFLLAALRYGIGTDYFATYVPLFNGIANGTRAFNEMGFNLFVKCLQLFTNNSQWFFVVTSFITITLTYYAIKNNSYIYWLSIFIYLFGGFYYYGYSGIRQALATAIFLYAIKYIRTHQFRNYILCIIVAFSFHNIAILYLPIYWIGKIKIEKKTRFLIIGISYIISPFIGEIFRTIISYTQYGWYLGSKFDIGEDNILLGLINIYTLLIGLFLCKEKKDYESSLYLNLQTIPVIIWGCSKFLPAATRIIFLFFYSNVITVPYFFYQHKNNKNKTILLCVTISFYFVFWLYTIIWIDSLNIVPYQSII